jgi:hypothetical protein
MKKAEIIPVKPGQIWQDNDKRMPERYLQVMRIDGRFAFCRKVVPLLNGSEYPWSAKTERTSRLQITRLRPTAHGYRLVDSLEPPT